MKKLFKSIAVFILLWILYNIIFFFWFLFILSIFGWNSVSGIELLKIILLSSTLLTIQNFYKFVYKENLLN